LVLYGDGSEPHIKTIIKRVFTTLCEDIKTACHGYGIALMGDCPNTMAYLCFAVIALIVVSAVKSNLDLEREVSTHVPTEFKN
jgi:hypothetical protein